MKISRDSASDAIKSDRPASRLCRAGRCGCRGDGGRARVAIIGDLFVGVDGEVRRREAACAEHGAARQCRRKEKERDKERERETGWSVRRFSPPPFSRLLPAPSLSVCRDERASPPFRLYMCACGKRGEEEAASEPTENEMREPPTAPRTTMNSQVCQTRLINILQ